MAHRLGGRQKLRLELLLGLLQGRVDVLLLLLAMLELLELLLVLLLDPGLL